MPENRLATAMEPSSNGVGAFGEEVSDDGLGLPLGWPPSLLLQGRPAAWATQTLSTHGQKSISAEMSLGSLGKRA